MSKQISISSFYDTELQRYLKSISTIKMLTAEEEYELSLDVYNNQNKESAHKLVISHLPLVVKIACSYRGYGLSVLDLISEGNIGLIRAVAKFNPLKGNRLSTYAIFWIKAYITDYILNSWSLVKFGTIASRKKLFFSLNKLKTKLGISGSNLTVDNIKAISKESGVSEVDVVDINSMIQNRDFYLQASVYKDQDNSATFEDSIESKDNNPQEEYEEKEAISFNSKLVKEAFSILNDREKYILIRRYQGEEQESLESIGNKLQISRERVRQIEKLALEKAKGFLLDRYKESSLLA